MTTVSKVHCILSWTKADVDAVQKKRWQGNRKLLSTYKCDMFLQHAGR